MWGRYTREVTGSRFQGRSGIPVDLNKTYMLAQIARILVIVGGINWGLVGLGMLMGNDSSAWNVVHMIFGSVSMLEAVIYVLVGISAVMMMWPRR